MNRAVGMTTITKLRGKALGVVVPLVMEAVLLLAGLLLSLLSCNMDAFYGLMLRSCIMAPLGLAALKGIRWPWILFAVFEFGTSATCALLAILFHFVRGSITSVDTAILLLMSTYACAIGCLASVGSTSCSGHWGHRVTVTTPSLPS